MPRAHVTIAVTIPECEHVPRSQQPINPDVNRVVYVLTRHYAVVRGILRVCAANLVAAIQLLRDADAPIAHVLVLPLLTFLVRVLSSLALLNDGCAVIDLRHINAVRVVFHVHDYLYCAVIVPILNVSLLVAATVPAAIVSARGLH